MCDWMRLFQLVQEMCTNSKWVGKPEGQVHFYTEYRKTGLGCLTCFRNDYKPKMGWENLKGIPFFNNYTMPTKSM